MSMRSRQTISSSSWMRVDMGRATNPMIRLRTPCPCAWGTCLPSWTLFYQLSLETFVPQEHPLRAIRPLIEDAAIRRACRDLYAPIGRPSIPPEQLFLALVGGYLLGVTSERKLVMELQCNMALRWFVGLNLDQDAWDASTFSQNRRRRFDESGLLEQLFDDTIKRAMAAGLVSRHG